MAMGFLVLLILLKIQHQIDWPLVHFFFSTLLISALILVISVILLASWLLCYSYHKSIRCAVRLIISTTCYFLMWLHGDKICSYWCFSCCVPNILIALSLFLFFCCCYSSLAKTPFFSNWWCYEGQKMELWRLGHETLSWQVIQIIDIYSHCRLQTFQLLHSGLVMNFLAADKILVTSFLLIGYTGQCLAEQIGWWLNLPTIACLRRGLLLLLVWPLVWQGTVLLKILFLLSPWCISCWCLSPGFQGMHEKVCWKSSGLFSICDALLLSCSFDSAVFFLAFPLVVCLDVR